MLKVQDIPVLLLWVDSNDPELRKYYQERIDKHNENVLNDPYSNSGFDIATSCSHTLAPSIASYKIDFKVKALMGESKDEAIGYYLYPRSSIAKTPLLLSNHVGIIDSGYRGYLIGAFRNLSNEAYSVEKHERMLQICHPTLKPFLVHMVETDEELGNTLRGSGGFGSTGK